MKVGFKELDFWLARGFGGIINMLHTRCTQFKQGWSQKARALIDIETRRLAELNDAVQINPEEDTEATGDMSCVDRWLIMAFFGLDTYLGVRSQTGPTPIDEINLQQIEAHVQRLLHIVQTERRKVK